MVRARRAILAGFWGGMLAGVLDAAFHVEAAAKVMGATGSLHLLAIAAGLGALAGSTLAMVFIGWSLGLERLLGRSRWFSGGHAVALLLVAPLLIYDAFALFGGHRAAQIPAHNLISVLLILLGAASVWAAMTLWCRWLSRAEGLAAEQGRGGRATLLGVGLGLVLTAMAVGWANRNVLPRLYPWFHLSLTLLGLVLCVLAVRLVLAVGRRPLGRRWSWLLAALALFAFLAGAAIERSALARSQSLRYFVAEKTQLAGLFSGLLRTRQKGTPRLPAAPAGDARLPLPDGPHRPDADVVLITIDALRADHVGCYGYPRPTTPHIDALARSGVRFARAYTQAPHTSFALASLMIGKYYATLARLAPSDTHETVASILRRYGWKTAAFFPPAVFYIDAHKMKAFETNNFDFEYVKYEYLDAEARVGQIEEFLRKENPRKLFLWLHLFEPHEPYDRHPGFDFGERDIDRYDDEIAYSDKVVGQVLALLAAKRPGAIVILAADHGEEFGEHGGRYHGSTLHDEQVRVPLIVTAPGLRPRVVTGPVEIVDVPATILGLLDIPVPLRMRGTDLGPWLAEPPAAEALLPPAFAEVEGKRMVALGGEKLLCDLGKDYCSYFDLVADPGEQRNLADQRANRVAALREHLDVWLSQQARFETTLIGAAGGRGELAAAIERGRLVDVGAALPLAQALLGSDDLSALREAASLLVRVLPPRPETKNALLAAQSKASDAEVSAWAAMAALRVGATEMQEPVRALLRAPATEGRAVLRTHAALALAENADATGLPVLVSALDSCSNDVVLCRRVVVALGRLKDPSAVEPLIAHLEFLQTRRSTVKALGEIGDTRVVGPLIDCLEHDPYVLVRMDAANALGRIRGARAVQGLRAALQKEQEDAVLAVVRTALSGHGRGR